jgi:hypothetical protein
MWYVQVVGKQQLKRVLSRGEREFGLCSAIAEMDVMIVRRDRQAEHW